MALTAQKPRKSTLKTTKSKLTAGKSKPKPRAPPPKQQKTKAPPPKPKKKRPVYTEKELGIPTLNMITPVGVQKPKGKKKGKIFVDDTVGEALRGLSYSLVSEYYSANRF